MSAPLASRRDAPVICAGCGRQVQRQSRQQRFCSTRCQQQARTRARPRMDGRPIKNDQRATLAVLRHEPSKKPNRIKGPNFARIGGPPDVLDVEVFGGRQWRPAVSGGGVPIEVGRLRARALVGAS